MLFTGYPINCAEKYHAIYATSYYCFVILSTLCRLTSLTFRVFTSYRPGICFGGLYLLLCLLSFQHYSCSYRYEMFMVDQKLYWGHAVEFSRCLPLGVGRGLLVLLLVFMPLSVLDERYYVTFALFCRISLCRLSRCVVRALAMMVELFDNVFAPSNSLIYFLGHFVLKLWKEIQTGFRSCKLNRTGYENWRFWPIPRFISKTVQDMVIVTMKDE